MNRKFYIITFHAEDFLGTYSKNTIARESTSVKDLINEIEQNWKKENQRIVIDFLYAEAIK